MALDPTKIPAPLRQLLPVAEKWGIGDDFEREATLSAASQQELEALVHSIDAISDDDLFGWLAGTESHNPKASQDGWLRLLRQISWWVKWIRQPG